MSYDEHQFCLRNGLINNNNNCVQISGKRETLYFLGKVNKEILSTLLVLLNTL